jgi:hypothetical protein
MFLELLSDCSHVFVMFKESVVDVDSGTVTKAIKLKFPPFSIVLSPDQSKRYAVKASSGCSPQPRFSTFS